MTTTPRLRTLPALALVVTLVVTLGGCGTRAAVDAAAPAATLPPDSATAHPSGSPSAPPWPAYGVEDYAFTLRIRCFCPNAGVPVTVTVSDGKVVDAVIARKGSGRPAGAPAPAWARVTINDIIDAANDTGADTVKVRWPAGQDYPTSVWVDRDSDTIDEEIGYTIRDVVPA